MGTLTEAILHLFTNFLLLHHYEALIWRLVIAREGGSVRDTHVVNTVLPSLLEVVDQHISRLLRRLFLIRFMTSEISTLIFMYPNILK